MTTIWIALDVADGETAEVMMERLAPHRTFKVGLELFSAVGPARVQEWTSRGFRVFLDMKLHDIPRTVGRATERLSDLGVSLLTVHAAGGPAMIESALRKAGSHLTVAAVTVLTSLDAASTARLGVPDPGEWSLRLARVAKEAGVDAVVCSGHEVRAVREAVPISRYVVPGVRLAGDDPADQVRVADPKSAVAEGATDLVVGRAVVGAPDPSGRLRQIEAMLQGGVRA